MTTRFRIKEEESHVHIIKTDPKLQFARLTPSAPVSAFDALAGDPALGR
jgi:hypothetical protein